LSFLILLRLLACEIFAFRLTFFGTANAISRIKTDKTACAGV